MRRFSSAGKFVCLFVVLLLLPTFIARAAGDPVHGNLAFVEVKYGNIQTYQASSVEISPDGQYLYLGASSTITVFKRNAATGRLLRVQSLNDDGTMKISFLDDMVISPDGKHLYTASSYNDAVSVLIRNTSTGMLTFAFVVRDGSSADGLDGVMGLAISPDGNYLYAAGTAENAIARFSRISTTGALIYIDKVVEGGSITELEGVYDLAISADGNQLYAVAQDDDAVTTFSRNIATGGLTYVEHDKDGEYGVDGLHGARRLTISPGGQHVYIAAGFDAAVTTFQRNVTTGALTFIEVDKDSPWMLGVSDVLVSPDGNHVYVSSYANNNVSVYRRNASNGRLTFLQHVTNNTGTSLYGPLQMAISPDGYFLYIASRNGGALAVFKRHPDAGLLTYQNLVEALRGVDGPVGVAVSPDGKNIYIASNDANRLVVCERNPVTGKLHWLESFRDNHDGVNGLAGARAVAVSPDGKNVYVAGHSDNGIARFHRYPDTGTLIFGSAVLNSDAEISGLSGIQSLTISPDGQYVYAVSVGDDANPDADSLVVFNREATYGTLSFVKQFRDGVDADGLDDAYHVAVSSEGKHVYVAGYDDDAVSHFEWLYPGGLTYRSTIKDGHPSSVDGLDGANYITISPDGAYLYVAGRNDDAIVKFIRGTSNGLLGYHSMIKDGVDGVDGLNGVRAITMNPVGTYLYAASQLDDALAVFSRDTAYGDLTYFTSIKDTDPWIDGLNTANGIAISPASNHVYVASYDDDAISVFVHNWGIYVPMVMRE